MGYVQRAVLYATLFVLASAGGAYGQGGTTQYLYDANGRLSAVVSPAGDAVIYRYDPAGNLTGIDHVSAGSLAVLSFSPQIGTIGDQITLTGVGLDTVSAVSFNGAAAQIISASASSLTTAVPAGAGTGPITVSGVRGSFVSADTFTVVARVDVSPQGATILPGEAVQFQASVVGTPNQQVTWSVNGIVGGNSANGTIDASGLYQSPSLETGFTAVISASSQLDNAVAGQAAVRLLNPNTTSEVRAPGVSIGLGLVSNVSAGLESPGVSIQKGNQFAFQSPAVAVGVGETVSVTSHSVSADFQVTRSVISSSLSATTGPAIASIAPASITRGTPATITVFGQNLGGTTAVSFRTPNGNLATNISVSNISVSADGTTLTFTANATTAAAAGTDIVYVSAGNGRSPTTDTGNNRLQIQ